MSNKRREDDAHDIGDSKPGDVGDSTGTHHDNGDTPMARIHNRRDGDLLSEHKAKAAYSDDEAKSEKPGHDSDEEAVSKYCDGSRDTRESTDAADEWEEKFESHHLPNGETYNEQQS